MFFKSKFDWQKVSSIFSFLEGVYAGKLTVKCVAKSPARHSPSFIAFDDTLTGDTPMYDIICY